MTDAVVPYFQAIGDPTRLRLLRLLMREELNVREAVRISGLGQSTVSKHLAVLRDAGWVVHRREGTWSWYRAAGRDDFAGGAALHDAVRDRLEDLAQVEADDAALAETLAARDRRSGDFFDGIAADWDTIRPAFEHPDVQSGAMGALAPLGLKVVDIGTGTGALLPLLLATGAQVTAVDNSEAMLARARRQCLREGAADVRFKAADIQALPFSDGEFDVAFCSMVLHHVSRPARAVQEMARVVKTGGRVVVIGFTDHDQAWMREKLAHQWLGFPRDEIEGLFERFGLRPWHYLVRAAADAPGAPAEFRGRDVAWPDVFLAVGVRDGG